MKEILSADGVLLHLVIRQADFPTESAGRIDIIDSSQFIQLAIMNFDSGSKFAPHAHLERIRTFDNLRAQESWVVITGKVRVTYFDELDKIVSSEDLGPGDCSVTLFGGHGYEILENSTRIFEFKTGPYEGQEIDKRFITLNYS